MFKVHIDKASVWEHINEVLDSGFLNEGEQVTEFQNKLSEYLKHKNTYSDQDIRPKKGYPKYPE